MNTAGDAAGDGLELGELDGPALGSVHGAGVAPCSAVKQNALPLLSTPLAVNDVALGNAAFAEPTTVAACAAPHGGAGPMTRANVSLSEIVEPVNVPGPIAVATQ